MLCVLRISYKMNPKKLTLLIVYQRVAIETSQRFGYPVSQTFNDVICYNKSCVCYMLICVIYIMYWCVLIYFAFHCRTEQLKLNRLDINGRITSVALNTISTNICPLIYWQNSHGDRSLNQ